jgi:hypothetical protein
MAQPNQYFQFRKTAEGGLSRAKTDSVSKNPKNFAPGKFKGYDDWHTNKGIIWPTFFEIAPLVGIAPTFENFILMSPVMWELITSEIWRRAGGYLHKSTALANLVFQSRWGSGPNALKYLSKWYGDYFKTTPKTWEAIAVLSNKAYDEGKEFDLFNYLWSMRYNFLSKLGDEQPANKKGWLRGWDSFKAFNMPYMFPDKQNLPKPTQAPQEKFNETDEEIIIEKKFYQKPWFWLTTGGVVIATTATIWHLNNKRKNENAYNYSI